MKIQVRSMQQGFTLIEIMVVVVIIGTMTAIIAPNIFGRADEAKQVAARAGIGKIVTQMQMYRLDNFDYPTTSAGIQSLVSKGGTGTNGHVYFDNMPLDPWDNEYQYIQPGQKNPAGFDVWSFGKDGAPGGEGFNKDIGNWKD